MKRVYFISLLLLGFIIRGNAQTKSADEDKFLKKPSRAEILDNQQINFIKVNLTAIPLKNYSIQYERTITRKFSFAIAFRTMPSTTIPFKNQIINAVGADDPDTKETIEKLKITNFAITPEARFYLSKKGFGRGFYVAPFYRYATFKTNDLVFSYEDDKNNKSIINLNGKLTSNTAGLLFGIQSYLGKRLCLDLWLLGPHYGSGTGNFNGISSKPLTVEEQNDLKTQLENIDIPLTNKTVTVTSNGTSLKLNGPWGGIRTGISIGVKF